MVTYFDPIDLGEFVITAETILYLVKMSSDDLFSIKGVSSGIDQLSSDPTTHATQYWIIDTISLINNESKNQTLFPSGKLVEKPLSLSEVIENLHFNPNTIVPKEFSQAIGN
jgi:hypothetical protein